MPDREPEALWSPEAIDDVDRLWDDYADTIGPATADKVLREIQSVVSMICEFPLAGRSRDELRLGLRSIATGLQIVFYRPINNQLQIVRIIDGRRDVESIFAKGDPRQE